MEYSDYTKLREYARLDGTEVGEVIELLTDVVVRTDYISEELLTVIEKELAGTLTWFKENTEIIELENTTTYKYKELERLDI